MDHHGRYGQPAFTAGNPSLHFHSPIPSEVPIYMHQVLNPNAPHTNTFNDTTTTTISPPLPPPPPPTFPCWGGITDGINLNQGANNYAQTSTTIRWPRQETLTLLEIRSRLDHCFKEATSSNHKSPLWDEISRIMNEEYGYQRSGRKCKEKFENLYKYYKKTKEGKVGKNDGKHYRFFRQLEALFGDQHRMNNNMVIVDPSSQSNYSSEYGTPSYEKNKRSGDDEHYDEFKKKNIIDAIEESIELHFTQLMVRQEEWGKKILCTIESKERERAAIEEEWRKQEGARLEQEYEAWASHVGRIEARDKSLLEYLQTLIRVKSNGSASAAGDADPESGANSKENGCASSDNEKCRDWSEPEISSLIHIRANKECKFQEVDQEHVIKRLWVEVAFELSLLGYKRSEYDCKETWEKICVDFNKRKMECENTSKEVSSRSSNMMSIDGKHSWEAM